MTVKINIHLLLKRYSTLREEVQQVVEAVELADFVAKLPESYDMMVGGCGLKLSGGEKQRVAIARALLKNPAIYLFDEATSALDSRTEKNIQQALNKISRTRTTVVIAHRLSTITDADEISVIADGKIAERGTHTQLLSSGGLYALCGNVSRSDLIRLFFKNLIDNSLQALSDVRRFIG